MAKHSCYLYSKANFPILIRYDKTDLIVPPYAQQFLIEDESKLGELPAKITKLTIKEEK